MAVGRISGPLLKANLLRDGVDLAFETDLLYLDVVNGKVGIKTQPNALSNYDLGVNGTTRTTDLEVINQADIAEFTLLGNTISSSNGTINLSPAGANPVVYQAKLVLDDLQISGNTIEVTASNEDLNFDTVGTGKVNINSDMLVNGDVHVTGNITADGDIQIGDANTDNITFNADINSNVIPDQTDTYDLGSDPTVEYTPGEFGKAWKDSWIKTINATNVITDNISVNGIDLAQPQGNIYYVAETGNDTNTGEHEHDPVATVKYALSLTNSGDVVYIYPGVYTEIFPLTVPAGVTIRGSGLRAVTIQPTVGTVSKDAFLLNGETTIEDLTVANFRFNSVDNTGYAFRFAPSFTVTSRSPYIRNCSVISKGSETSVSDPYGFDSDDAGKGAFINGADSSPSSNEASMLFHSVTFFTPNQECIVATNGARIEWLNSFTYFADKGIYAYSSSAGLGGIGKTRLRISTQTGSWNVGDTLTYYDTDGTTVLASGTISSIDGEYVNITGRQLGFETITDRAGKTVYAQGNAKLSTVVKKFGTASLALDGTGDYANVVSQPDFNFGTDDFTVEFWINRNNASAVEGFLDFRTTATQDAGFLYANGSSLYYYVGGANRITAASALTSASTWYHIAYSRQSGNTKLFVDGTQVGSTWTDSTNYIQSPLTIGSNYTHDAGVNGYIDDLRITKGTAKYTGNFIAPTLPLTGDLSTVLLLHFNGANNSTTFIDDGVTYQDLRTTSGGTSNLINFADYSDFGAEIRSIGSASIYGNYGAYGDGPGVVGYLISQNFAYVGSGKLSTNDPTDRIAANEVVELNSARFYYTSVDNEGNFSVGNAFYVNQKTGDVLFNSETLSISVPAGVTFTDGVNSTTITATEISTGNILIAGNTVSSITGDVNITAASGEINLQNDTNISGDLDVTGDVTIGGNIIIGDQNTDTINLVGGINSDLIPATTETYDLGSSSQRWDNIYVNQVEVDGLVINNNTISTTIGNDNLTLSANGSGIISIPTSDVSIGQDLTVDGDLTVTTGTTYLKATNITGDVDITGTINQTGDIITSGTLDVTGNLTASGYLQLPEITISGNTISTTVTGTDLVLTANGTGNIVVEDLEISNASISATGTNQNITLTPQGTGSVVINSNQTVQIPVGTTAERPNPASLGMIRYNTDLDQYEGWTGSYWLSLGGVKDADGNTYILPEATPGANDDTLYFYANGNLTVTIDAFKLFAERLQTASLDINNNTITTVNTNTDINLNTSGTGSVVLENFSIKDNTLTNTTSGAVTVFSQTGTGYVKIEGTNGVVIPAGDTVNDRPLVPETGMIRFNTSLQLVEVYNGTLWASVAGVNAGISILQAEDLGVVSALIFG